MVKLFSTGLFLTLSLFFSCKNNSKSNIDVKSLTEWFYVIDSDDGIQIPDNAMLKKVYIDPTPIVTDKNFGTAQLSESDFDRENFLVLEIQLDKEGTEKLRQATSEYKGKQLAFMISGEPLMVPLVQSVIEKGDLSFLLDKKKYSKEQIKQIEKLVRKVSNKLNSTII